jgi:hypothetical protein
MKVIPIIFKYSACQCICLYKLGNYDFNEFLCLHLPDNNRNINRWEIIFYIKFN